MNNEVWKDIPNYEGIYQASNLGRIKSINPCNRGKDIIMSDKPVSPNDYKKVCFKRGGKQKTFLVHRLIAITFIPNPNSYPVVNHKNENKSDNRVENLEWCDYSYNASYGSKKHNQTVKLGKKVLCVELNLQFLSFGEASRYLNIPYQNISKCCHGKVKTAGGYHWELLDSST